MALGLGAATLVGLALPSTAFRARALVEVADIASPLSALLSRAAADATVSEPVMRRAAESLIGTNVAAPSPDLIEQIGVAAGFGGAHATGQAARLAGDLAQSVTVKLGDLPGSLEIFAESPDRARAAQIATAVAEALIADRDEVTAQGRRKRDVDAMALVDRLQAAATSARRRLAALGGAEADPAQIRATAAQQTAVAQARVDIVHAIIESSSPPLSDRRDVPSGIEALQTNYLDLTRQLAKAHETLGDRHTTIISLQAEVKHAAASLTAEWRRLSHLAEGELNAARQREASLRKPETAAAATRRDSVEAARRDVETADDTLMRAQAGQHETPITERGYRLMAPAAIPTATTGFSLVIRVLAASLAGVLALLTGLSIPRPRDIRSLLSRGRRAARARLEPSLAVAITEPAPANVAVTAVAPRDRTRSAAAEKDVAEKDVAERDVAERGAAKSDVAEGRLARAQAATRTAAKKAVAKRQVATKQAMETNGEMMRPTRESRDEDLMRALSDLLPSLDAIDPEFGAVPTIMVAANEKAGNEMAAGTMPIALALGRAAVEEGYRVLVVETARARPELATQADADADPVLIDLFGVLRVALRAEATDGCLYLAPSLEHGARIASALARQGDTLLVDDLAAEFDLIVIDGDHAGDSAAAGWGADAYVRVGRFASQRDDDHFAATFGVSTEDVLGTIVASAFAPKASRPVQRPVAGPKHLRGQTQPAAFGAAPVPQAGPARPPAFRRKVGAR